MLIPAERYFEIEGREWGVYLGIIDEGLERGLRRNIFFVATNHYSKQDKKTPPQKKKKKLVISEVICDLVVAK